MLYNMYYCRFFVAIMKAKTVVFVLDNGKLLLLSLLINLPHVFILWEYTLICVKTGYAFTLWVVFVLMLSTLQMRVNMSDSDESRSFT